MKNILLNSFLLFLFLFILGFPIPEGFLDFCGSLSFLLLHEIPQVLPFPICLQQGLFSLSFLFDLQKMPFQVVKLVGESLELFLSVVASGVQLRHLWVISGDEIRQVSFVGEFVCFGLGFHFRVLVPEFVHLSPFLINQSSQRVLLLFVVASQCLTLFFAIFGYLLHFALFVTFHLPNLAFQFIHLLFLFFGMLGSVLPQLQ